MKLPESWTKVTLLSKILAILLFVSLPFIGFYLGRWYQGTLDKNKIELNNSNLTPTENIQSITNKLDDKELLGKNIFSDEVPNFENLKLSDLPMFDDYRGYYDFGDTVVIMGVYRLIVYDKNTNKIIKQNKELTNMVSSALVDKYLYIGTNGGWMGTRLTSSTIYKINMQTGIIEKIYFGEGQSEHLLVNIRLLSDGTTLWGGSDEEVFKMDTNTDNFEFYSLKDLGFPEKCKAGGIYKDKAIKVATWNDSRISCEGGSIYDEKFDKWLYVDTTKNTIKFKHSYQIVDELTKIIPIKLPYYFGISNKINNKYYLFTGSEIYTLVSKSFPNLLRKLNKAIDTQIVRVYITQDEKYAVVFSYSADESTEDTLAARDPIYLINLNTGSVNNLTDREIYKSKFSENSDKFERNLNECEIVDSGTEINIIDSSNKTIATISVSKEEIVFY